MPLIHYMLLQKLKTHKIEIIAARPHFLVWQMNQIDSKNNIKSRKYYQLKENLSIDLNIYRSHGNQKRSFS